MQTATPPARATVPPGFELKSLEAYNRRKRTFPAKTILGKICDALQDVVEGLVAKF